MPAPLVQISYNDMEISLYWDQDIVGSYVAYNLYWSFSSDMSGEILLKGGIPNTPDGNFSNKAILYKFKREDIGANENSIIYLRLKGVSGSSVEDSANPGEIKRISSLPELLAQYRTTQLYGYDSDTGTWRKLRSSSGGIL